MPDDQLKPRETFLGSRSAC